MGQPTAPPPRHDDMWSRIGASIVATAIVFGVLLIFFYTLLPRPSASDDAKPQMFGAGAPAPMPSGPLKYPATRTVEDSDTYFGVKVPDPYRWLEDTQSDEVQTWLTAENKLARQFLNALPYRPALVTRYGQLLHIDTISAPSRAGDRYFYMKRRADQEKSVLYWRSAIDPTQPEHVLLDPNQFVATDNSSLGTSSASLDGKYLAYTLKPNNADEAILYVMDIDTGQNLPGEIIYGAKYAEPSWLPDGSGFVYTYLPPADPKHPENRPGLAVVKFHKLGFHPKNDPIIHDKTGDPTKFIGADVSRDGKWMFFEQENGTAINDVWYQPLKGQPTAALAKTWKPIVVGKPFAYGIEAWKGDAYILTNENAPHYHVFKASMQDLRRDKWKEIVPESPNYVVNGASIVGNHIVINGMENVASRIEIRELDGQLGRVLALPEIGSAGAGGDPDYDELFYDFDNFTNPPAIYKTSVTGDAVELWAQIKFPVDPAPYEVEQKFFASKDGTKVPMFVVHRKDMPKDGSTPFVIYGYGGFDISQLPNFWAGAYPWLESGGGFAMVNLRGGGEFGEQWHRDGMLLKKQHVFDDCIAAAETLVNEGYTKPERLAVRGGSNGGLLVGAVITERPDLFRAAVCEAPLLDMIRYTKFGSGQTWIPEYGSPEKEDQFKALLAYSPYEHVVPGTAYPAVLFCTPQNDDRVAPMHAFKMAAALQAATSSPNPILLRVETQSGHGGGDQVSKTIQYGADIWGFLIQELGAKPPVEDGQWNASH